MWHLAHTGHQKLSDGSVLRLDAEMGAYVAAWYRVDLSMRACAYGTFDAMRALVGDWADAYEASMSSSAVGAEGSGAGPDAMSPAQLPNNLKEIA